MKFKKYLVVFILINLLSYLLLSFSPITINKVYAEVPAGTLSRDIDGIDDNQYPGYKNAINELRAKFPSYTFLAYYTGLNWNEVLVAEHQGHGFSPRNLVPKSNNYGGKWCCSICGTTNFDNGSWGCASLDALSYMMDPRNSLNENDVFQFKDLDGADVSYSAIASVVSSYGSYINNPEAIQAIYDASVQYNINAFFLVARIINEQGVNGSTLTSGVNGLYNYFNVGAYGNSTQTIIANGLAYAQSHNWTSIRNSIFGGAAICKESYINQYSQNTFYYQKFNVSGRSALASHQYQQNIMAAQSQGTSYKSYYNKVGALNGNYTFIIPLYTGMPASACPRPDTSISNSITYENATVKLESANSLNVRASANGTAIGKLNNNESIKILSRAQNKVGNYYWDLIVSNVDGTYGYAARDYLQGNGTNGASQTTPTTPEQNNLQPAPEPTIQPQPEQPNNNQTQQPVQTIINDAEIKVNSTYLNVVPNLSAETLKAKYSQAIIKDKNGNDIASGKIGTGAKVTVGNTTYTVVKRGDTDGDGNVSVLDAVNALNALTGNGTLSNEFYQAACTKGGSSYNITDIVLLLNSIRGEGSLVL